METNHYSKSELGDIRNLDNLKDYISYCQSLEPVYSPMNGEVETGNMTIHHTKAAAAFEDLRTKRMVFILITNTRQAAFEDLAKLATRLNGAVKGGGYNDRIMADFRTITRKIQGRPSKPKTMENQPNQEIERAVSNSQQSFVQLIDNLADAIRFLEQLSGFLPSEADLQIPNLQVLLQELKDINKQVFDAFIPYSKALDTRDEIFYDDEKGFIKRVMNSREYIKSIYGYNSPQYKFARSIRFKTFRRD